MTYGNYYLLMQMLVEPVLAAPFETELERQSLCILNDRELIITESGKKYLKKHKQPDFPKLGKTKMDELFDEGLGI